MTLPPTTEAGLFYAYRNTRRVERVDALGQRTCDCACGGSITAPTNDDIGVTHAMQRHQQTASHSAWRAWQEAVA